MFSKFMFLKKLKIENIKPKIVPNFALRISIVSAKHTYTANAYRELQGTKWTQGNPLLYKGRIYYRKRDPL